jgi:hypothetical protein
MTAARKKPADDSLTVGLAQIAPVWLNREKTLAEFRPGRPLRPAGRHPAHRQPGAAAHCHLQRLEAEPQRSEDHGLGVDGRGVQERDPELIFR